MLQLLVEFDLTILSSSNVGDGVDDDDRFWTSAFYLLPIRTLFVCFFFCHPNRNTYNDNKQVELFLAPQ